MKEAKCDVVFYFGDPDERNSLYQLKQWIQPLERLAKHTRVAVVTASDRAAELVQQTTLKHRNYASMEESIQFYDELSPAIILYPNQFFENFSIWGNPDAFHVFVSHGESDKTYMSQNSLQFFDYVFTAGDIAKMRIRDHVPGFSQVRCVNIGRPQLLDKVGPTPDFFRRDNNRQVILYAPTWEGGLPQNRYGSLQSHGLAMVRAILKHGDMYQLIYKPHPFTGSIFPAASKINKKISDEIRSAGSGHVVDQSPFGWQAREADLLITDVSAVAYDWLATAKPILITKPNEIRAEVYAGGILGAVELIDARNASDICKRIEESLRSSDSSEFFAKWSRKYFASAIDKTTQTERFVLEVLNLLLRKRPTYKARQVRQEGRSSRRSGFRGFLINRLPLKFKLRVIDAISTAFNWPVETLDTVALHLSVNGLNTSVLRELAQSRSVLLVAGSTVNFVKLELLRLKDKNLRGNLQVRFAPSAKDVVALIKSQQPTQILYLSHGAHNHFGIRLNGIKHVLYKPEKQAGFVVDHNLIAYNEIVTGSSEIKTAIESRVFRPEGWNISLTSS